MSNKPERNQEFYKCPKTGNPKARNPSYKTPDKPKESEQESNFGKSGYENDDITHGWGPGIKT